MSKKINIPDMFNLSSLMTEAITEFIESVHVSFHVTDNEQGLDILVASDVEFDTEENGKIITDIVSNTLPLESLLIDLYVPTSEEQTKEVEYAVTAPENLAKHAREKYLGG